MLALHDLLSLMIEREASDLHITTGCPPKLRISGKLLTVPDCPPLTPEETRELCLGFLTVAQRKLFEERNETDLSFGIAGLSRFRANLFMQRGAVAGAFRAIPFQIKTLGELGLPGVVEQFLKKPRGLLLITGPAGSGKSTTLAAMIDWLNTKREGHIITIESPIEFVHHHRNCIVNQREVHSDTPSFASALRHSLRQNPDSVLVSDLPDRETIEAAISLAESGHLTLAALPAHSGTHTLGSIIDAFPPHQQDMIRGKLSSVLEGVLSQQLLPRRDTPGRVLALEVLVPTPVVRGLIREGKLAQVYSVMQSGTRSGSQTMNQSLLGLSTEKVISADDAVTYSPFPDEMVQMLSKAGPPGGQKQKR
ncbi:MAG: PilT/PilU family type 4a pilus ATPase [Alphaproteobacteria bacterium]|uniref:PilT/PilU family type 4a pilus ATPase n=1 Tax=Candidatus Nitrobium versatile TaxID=2884831 RepID=A0A953M3C2_9BACT|nr:PilT/PilU family type 4a pilus ATPase [Candidatus Nitrobium versatile]